MIRSTSENFESFLNVKKKLFIIVIEFIFVKRLLKLTSNNAPDSHDLLLAKQYIFLCSVFILCHIAAVVVWVW
mgnify:FL=1